MKPAEWRARVLEVLIEIRDLVKQLAEESGGGGDGGGGGGDGGAEHLEATIESLRAAYEAWPRADKGQAFERLTPLCAGFRNWLAATYANVETVNEQWARHRYQETDALRHADAIVLIRDRQNPSKDIVIDFCYGSSEGGRLADKLRCLWHEGPYPWWVDNAFEL